MDALTLGLSPPVASVRCSDTALAAYSAASWRSDVMLRPYLYPEEPAPRGLAGQELGTLGREETKNNNF